MSVRVAVPGTIVFSAVAATAVANGGYFPSAWGWPTLAFLVLIAGAAIVADTFAWTRLDWAMVGSLAAFVGWTALSALWAPGAGLPLKAAQLALVYVTAVAVYLAFGSRRSAPALPVGVLCAVLPVAAYALATRLVPDRVGSFDSTAGGYLLAVPVGYSNGLGFLCAIAALVAVGVVAESRRVAVRTAAATGLLVLLPTLYFTFSRGAGAAFVLGLVAAVLCARRRLHLSLVLVVTLPLPLLAAWLGSRAPALSEVGHPLADAAREGHRLLAVLVALAIVQAGVVVGLAALERRPISDRRRRGAGAALLVLLAVAVVVVGVARIGNPVSFVGRATDAFRSDAAPISGSLNARLVNLSSDYRLDYWSAAWYEVRAHPVLGGGGNEYRRYWLRHRPTSSGVLNAHSLYLETLADLGPIGLLLLSVGLAMPLVAAARARAAPLVPAATGAYVAFLAHAGIEWDWQLPVVVLSSLACGAALVLSARPEAATRPLPTRVRVPALIAVVLLTAFVFVTHLGNDALSASERAAATDEEARAAAEARRARRWLPWSAEPWQRLGEAQLAAGETEAAARSFREAVEQDPDEWSAWLDLALATRGRERAQARARAIELNPRGPVREALGG
jgi:tetratricopeptide (TPR) repeat protein